MSSGYRLQGSGDSGRRCLIAGCGRRRRSARAERVVDRWADGYGPAALEAAIKGDAADRSGSAADRRSEEADQETGEVSESHERHEDTGGTGGGQREGQGEQRAATTDSNGGGCPWDEADDGPAEEEEEDEGKTRFPNHETSVQPLGARVKR